MRRASLATGFILMAGLNAGATGGAPQMPFAFVENIGQNAAAVRYAGSGPDFEAWFEDGKVVLQQGDAVVSMSFVKGRLHPHIEAAEPIGAHANYIRGDNPKNWKTGLPMFGSLTYHDEWRGIDVLFKADRSRTKAEYVVAPGASPQDIRLRFDGVAEIESDGSLSVSNGSGEFRESKPVLFQNSASGRQPVAGSFRIFEDGTVGFTVGDYDAAAPLIVDPVILFSGYFGGSSQTNITSVAVNANFNVVVAGWTLGTDLPATNGARTHNGGGVDAFVANFSPVGGALVYCTYLGGSGDDRAFGLAVDSALNTYVTGWTSSSNFPVLGPVQTKLGGPRDAFVAKLNATGSALVYSTYLGGSGTDVGNGIALDTTNSAVIVGDTNSTNLPATTGAFQPHLAGGQDAFVAKLSPGGNALTFLTYFGGNGADHGAAIQVDSTNSVFIAGSTYSLNLPTLKAAQAHPGGGQDAFFAKLTAAGNALVFSSYLGGSGGSAGAPEEINALTVGPGGNPTAVGTTSSVDFPVTAGIFQTSFGGGQTDGFVIRFSSSTGGLLKSTYFGGSSNDGLNGVAVDYRGDVYVTGYTTSSDFPVVRPTQLANGGGMDAIAAKLTFPSIEFSTYLGGSGNDSGNAIAIDPMTSFVIAGSTGSGNLPVTGSVGAWSGSTLTSFLTKYAPDFNEALAAAPSFSFDSWHTTGTNGSNSTLVPASFGQASDIPVMADWDGSGVKRLGVFRSGAWLLDINGDGVFDAGDKTVMFGQAGDAPVVGDWNGTGRIKLGLYRQGTFILDLSGHLTGVPTGLSDATFSFGLTTDIPVVCDWNGSGTAKVGVFRNGQWLIDYNGDQIYNGLDRMYSYGQAGDIPITGNFDSAGACRMGLYRGGTWILDYHGEAQTSGSTQYSLFFTFGSPAYKPLTW